MFKFRKQITASFAPLSVLIHFLKMFIGARELLLTGFQYYI